MGCPMTTKICTKCRKEKDISCFCKSHRSKDGIKHRCKSCDNEYARAEYKKDPTKKKAHSVKWHNENKEKVKDIVKKSYMKHRERRRAGEKKWRSENKEKIRGQYRRWVEKNKDIVTDTHRRNNLRSSYSMTIEEYNKIFLFQGGKCAICGKPETAKRKWLSVDHDHKTGKIRELLCLKCNNGVGLFLDDPNLLELAASYLRQHTEENLMYVI